MEDNTNQINIYRSINGDVYYTNYEEEKPVEKIQKKYLHKTYYKIYTDIFYKHLNDDIIKKLITFIV